MKNVSQGYHDVYELYSIIFVLYLDKNECSAAINPCDENRSVCKNTDGGYECTCLSGYSQLVINNNVDNKHCAGMYVAYYFVNNAVYSRQRIIFTDNAIIFNRPM